MVGIKDFEMPNACMWECLLCNGDGSACWLDLNIDTKADKRPNNCPLIENVAPVIHAKWIEREIAGDCLKGDRKILMCSSCRLGIANGVLGFANFCPNCGARMDSKE